MIGALLKKVFGTANDRFLKRVAPSVEAIGALEPEISALSDADLAAKTGAFRSRLAGATDPGAALDELLPEAFACVREASRRSTGLRHFDVQMIGGIVLHEGKIAEMRTGEGKTLVATLAVYLNALAGKGVHVITVNDYLARRDATWMGPIYRALGISCASIGHEASLLFEGDDRMRSVSRREAYAADVTYGTNNEFGFDYLRDNMVPDGAYQVQRGHAFAIVDEVDSILIDEARTPLIISGPAEQSTDVYYRTNRIVPRLRAGDDYEVEEKDHVATLTEAGVHKCEGLLGVDNLYDPQNMDLIHHVGQALRAHTLYKRDVDYVVKDGEVIIVDEFTGRLMPGRRWSDGLHQAVESKEGLVIKRENQTLATITLQNYFRMYGKLAGMTGTAETEAQEFNSIYELDVVVVPTHRSMVRADHADVVFKTEPEKFDSVVTEITALHERGQPVLVGTISIEKSEVLSDNLRRKGVRHAVLNAKHHEKEAEIVAQAGRLGSVTIATNMAGRGTDILLGGNPEFLARQRAKGGDPEVYRAELERARAECAKEHDQVVELGGLHIIGTERHESRRIDNQLRGRAGRQGDPGSTRFYLALEDELMRLFGSERVQRLMEAMAWEKGEPLEHPWLTKAIARAQKRVEMMNFDRRKRLLDYDDVMNIQRKVVYGLRDSLLRDADVEAPVLEMVDEVVEAVVEADCPAGRHADTWDLDGLATWLRATFAVGLVAEGFRGLDREALRGAIRDSIRGTWEAQRRSFGESFWGGLVRQVALGRLDVHWKDHLYAMDSLREGIGWRGMGGKDPLVEYKQEGFALFEAMLTSMREETVRFLFHLRPVAEGSPRAAPSSAGATGDAGRFPSRDSGGESRGAPARRAAAASRNEEPTQPTKTGRNDPCPCGSGRKYKKCCGR